MTSASFIRLTLMLLAIGGLMLLGVAGSTVWLAQRANTMIETIASERQMRRSAADLLIAMQDAETGQRGYIITQDPAFLEPYEEAVQRVDRLFHQLEESIAAPSIEVSPLGELELLIAAKMRELSTTISLTGVGEVEEARRLIQQADGRLMMESIRDILSGLIRQSDELVSNSMAQQTAMGDQLRLFAILSGAVMFTLFGGAALLVLRHIRSVDENERKIRGLNASLEARVNERTEDLMRANQEVQRFAYIVTHDLRAPLVNVMGFTSELETSLAALQAYVLQDGEPLSEQQIREARTAAEEDLPEAIAFIRSSTRKMDSLINAILKISRDGRRQLRPERIDLEDLITQTAATVQHQVADGEGRVEHSVEVRSVISDRLSLEQILGNLIDNAVKYSHPQRALHLWIRAVPEGPRMVRIEVEDNGRGIAAEDHDRIFELFRRSGQQDKVGEGIGLAHVRSLARNLGGEITVKSTLGEGTTFILRLPSDLSPVMRTLGK